MISAESADHAQVRVDIAMPLFHLEQALDPLILLHAEIQFPTIFGV
jgi:hypothetical protein